jgi:iron complex outermembrane receptor protein
MGSYLKNKLHPELVFRTVIAQDRVSTNFGETATPAFALLDFNVRYQISKMLRVAAGVQNLFDEAYYEHLNRNMSGSPINAPGRNVFLSITLDLM